MFLEVSQLEVRYAGRAHAAVQGVTLSLKAGDIGVLIGPSGCGKTTLLRAVAGLEPVTGGEIRLTKSVVSSATLSVPPELRRIGMVFQDYALFPHLSVGRNVAFGIHQLPRAEQAARVAEVLKLVGLEGSEHRYPHELSGGQQQRVALARALVFDPELVLMDEPLGALDKQLREHMQMEIKHIHQRLGVTVVYVTHDQGEALTMSDRVAVFHQGEIQQIAPPRDLYEAPSNTFVAHFIGENNRLAGELVSRDGERCTVRTARGEQVEALAVKVGAPGEPVSLSIRPERVRINGASESCANRFSGRVAEFIYLGDHVRIRMEVCGNPNFFVKQPIAELDPALGVGDVVPLGWHVEHVRALDPLIVE